MGMKRPRHWSITSTRIEKNQEGTAPTFKLNMPHPREFLLSGCQDYAAIDDRFGHANMVAHLKALIEGNEVVGVSLLPLARSSNSLHYNPIPDELTTLDKARIWWPCSAPRRPHPPFRHVCC